MRRLSLGRFGLSLFSVVVVVCSVTAARAAESFAGKSIEFVIGFGPGGAYDTYSRLIAKYIQNQIPGKPSVVPKNMQGAGSARAANYLYFNAPQDGTSIGMVGNGLYLSQQLGEARIKFDMLQMNWIGRLTNNTPVLFAWSQSQVRSTDDLVKKGMIVAADGATPKLNYALLQALVGVNMKIISGYKHASEAMLAMERGEIHGLARPWPVILASHADLVSTGKIIPVLQTGAEKHEALPTVPRMIDLAKNDADRQLFEFIAQSSRIGQSVLAPSRVPSDVVALLRDAFMVAVNDPGFRADTKRAKLPLAILDGKQLAALVKRDGQYPAAVVARAKAVVKQVKGK
ncbi:MAG: Bug family tripartite tricarboxylate transporter substrate binding protein [Alphaproteobacteria bacterium]